MSSCAQPAAAVLNGNVEHRNARQAGAEWRPTRAAIERRIYTDVGASVKSMAIARINHQRVDWDIGDSVSGHSPGGRRSVEVSCLPYVLPGRLPETGEGY